MCEIYKGAIRIGAEMVEAYINKGIPLDEEYIANISCGIAYKIYEKSKEYDEDDKPNYATKDYVKRSIKRLKKGDVKSITAPSHTPDY